MSKKHGSPIVAAAGYLATFNHHLMVALRQAMTEEELYELLKAEDPKFIGRIVEVFITARRPTTLLAMLAAGEYDDDCIDPDITEKNFPVNPALFTTEGSKLFQLPKDMDIFEINDWLDTQADQAYQLDGIEKLLAFGAENPEEQRKGPILGLGSSFEGPRGLRYFPYLDGSVSVRDVSLNCHDPAGEWGKHWRVLASPKKPKR